MSQPIKIPIGKYNPAKTGQNGYSFQHHLFLIRDNELLRDSVTKLRQALDSMVKINLENDEKIKSLEGELEGLKRDLNGFYNWCKENAEIDEESTDPISLLQLFNSVEEESFPPSPDSTYHKMDFNSDEKKENPADIHAKNLTINDKFMTESYNK